MGDSMVGLGSTVVITYCCQWRIGYTSSGGLGIFWSRIRDCIASGVKNILGGGVTIESILGRVLDCLGLDP